MKQLFFAVLISLFGTSVMAQDQGFKPKGDNWNVEVNLNPISSNPVNISYLRFRYFNSPTFAVRTGLSMSGRSENPSDEVSQSYFVLNVKPGFEKHFAGTERLSPYFGAELSVSGKWASNYDEDSDTEITGAWSDTGYQQGYFRFGMNLLTGVDVYILKNLYIGTEIGFGMEVTNFADIYADPGPTDPLVEGGSFLQVGPNYNGAIRFGYIF